MAALGTRRKRPEPDVEINMVPIMNMFLVLIPFLLMSASFLNLKAIDTSVPVRAVPDSSPDEPQKSDIVVTAVIKLTYDKLRISVTSDALNETQLKALDSNIDWQKDEAELMQQNLVASLKSILDKYPKSNTLILSPDEDVIYEHIVMVMDTARQSEGKPLFPIVVISGEVAAEAAGELS